MMDDRSSVDINVQEDLDKAEIILNKMRSK